MRPLPILLAALFLTASSAKADEPEFKGPPPAETEIPDGGNLFLQPAPRILFTQDSRDVWTNYAVDSTGRWRPRVILAPFGSYYYYNGAHYPWANSNGRSFQAWTHD